MKVWIDAMHWFDLLLRYIMDGERALVVVGLLFLMCSIKVWSHSTHKVQKKQEDLKYQ